MHRMDRYIGALLLGAILIAPVVVRASNNTGDDQHQDSKERNRRYYDRDHRDYHDWDDREDSRYRRWRTERHEAYRPFHKVKRAEQRMYWNWRHEHPDD
jgi:hypothetical protein